MWAGGLPYAGRSGEKPTVQVKSFNDTAVIKFDGLDCIFCTVMSLGVTRLAKEIYTLCRLLTPPFKNKN